MRPGETFEQTLAAIVAESGVPSQNGDGRSDETAPPNGVRFTLARDVRPSTPRYAWEERVPLGAVTAVVGNPDLGKSTLAVYLAARLSRGQAEGDLEGEPVPVVVASAEDNQSTTVVPRLQAAGADLGMVHFADFVQDGLGSSLILPYHRDALQAKMQETGARFLIVDPLVSHLPAELNSWKDQHVRLALAPLARMAEDLDAAVVCIVHLNKAATTDLFLRVSGSIGIIAATRSVLLVAPDPDDPDGPERILAHGKSNLGPKAPTLRFRLEGRTVEGWEGEEVHTSGIAWLGSAPGLSIEDLLGTDDEERSERNEAADWLTAELASGPRLVQDLYDTAKAQRICSDRTLRRAKRQIGARSTREGFGPGFRSYWSLALEGHEPLQGQYLENGLLGTPPAQTVQVSPLEGHVSDIGPLGSLVGPLVKPDPNAVETAEEPSGTVPEAPLAYAHRRYFEDGAQNLFLLGQEMRGIGMCRPNGHPWTADALSGALGVGWVTGSPNGEKADVGELVPSTAEGQGRWGSRAPMV